MRIHYDHDKDLANEIASNALEKLNEQKLPPLPMYFALWYAYFANIDQDLKKVIDEILDERPSLTEEECIHLHERFLGDSNEELYRKAGDQIHATINDVSGLMGNVKSATSQYSGTLQDVTSKLSQASTSKDLENILDSVTQDTIKMMEQNRVLEEQLDRSSLAIEELKRDLEQVRKEAMTDGLTGLANRKSFDEQIRRMTEKSAQEGYALTLLMLDIDHFKAFNDNYGHQVGDQVLRLVARTLIESVKGRDVASRYGGEEFAIILPETNLDAGMAVGDNLRKAIAKKEVINRTSGENLGRITMSVGVAQHYEKEDIDSLIQRADAALYTAKHNGRNQVASAPTPSQSKDKKANS